MGVYLNKPAVEKHSESGECEVGSRRLRYASSSMQGWRMTMEDAHRVIPDFDKNSALFAVYDGHGGREVALYCAAYLGNMIKSADPYCHGNLPEALKEAFMQCDRMLLSPEAQQDMKSLLNENTTENEESSEDEQETSKLLQEAEMPLESLLAQYGTDKGENLLQDVLRREDAWEKEGSASNEDGPSTSTGVRSMLQMLVNNAGYEIHFEDSDSESEEEEEGEEGEGEGDEMVEGGEGEEEEERVSDPVVSAEVGDPKDSSSGDGCQGEEELTNGGKKHEKEETTASSDEHKQLVQMDTSSDFPSAESRTASTTAAPDDSTSLADDGSCLDRNTNIHDGSSPSGEDLSQQHEVTSERDTLLQSTTAAKCSLNESKKSEEDSTLLSTTEEKASSKCDSLQDENVLQQEASQAKGMSEASESHEDEEQKVSQVTVSKIDSEAETANTPIDEELKKYDLCSLEENENPSLSNTLTTQSNSDIPILRPKSKRSSKSLFEGRGLKDLLTSSVNEEPTAVAASNEDGGTVCWVTAEENQALSHEDTDHARLLRKRSYPSDLEDGLASEESPVKHIKVNDEGYHSGTTAVVCVLRGAELVVANAGDSRCVLCSNGKAVDLSFDHKPTDQAELQRIERAGGKVGVDLRVNGGLNLSRAIGDHFYKQNTTLPLEEQMISAMPDIQTATLSADDEFFVIACDGIWNVKSSQEVVDFVKLRLDDLSDLPTCKDLTRICESLCDACLARDTDNDGTGCDNMTCIVVCALPSSEA